MVDNRLGDVPQLEPGFREASRASKLWKHLLLALLIGLALRLFLIWRFPNEWADSLVYEELARNLIDHRVYGVFLDGKLTPVNLRMPGYPGFLAVVYLLFGRSPMATMLAQVVVDLCTCVLTAVLAALLAPESSRRRVFIAGLWLAATCPFLASYPAALVTETLTACITTAALVLLVKAYRNEAASPKLPKSVHNGKFWFMGALLVGLATLVRPETPLLMAATAAVVLIRWWRPADWPKVFRIGALLAVGLVLPLLPWAARNWHAFRTVQLLTPRYYEMPGDYTPRGFYAWINTWLVRMRDAQGVFYKLEDEPIPIENVPDSAFDSPEERKRVAALLDQYNATTTVTPELDAQFADLARERAARHPLRTYLWIPLRRSVSIWFTPRTDIFPYSSNIWPPAERWEEDAVGFSLTVGLVLVNVLYLGLALAAAWRWRRQPGVLLLVAFIVVRTAYFARVETPEPRYVLVCIPAVLALGALMIGVHQSSQE
ncbi:MAG: hypothetical protein ACXVZZ_08800 [Terriglobales bacterium]